MSFLVDTNICIGWLKGDARIKKRWLALRPGDVALSTVVQAELLFGARKSTHVEENLRRLADLFAATVSVPFNERAAEWYGVLRAQLERSGSLIGPNDLLIAASALAEDHVLVTRNGREFSRVPGLRIDAW